MNLPRGYKYLPLNSRMRLKSIWESGQIKDSTRENEEVGKVSVCACARMYTRGHKLFLNKN